MARVTKHCAVCGGNEPCAIRCVPPATVPGNAITWVATCSTCGNDHPPDSTEIVADGVAWAAAQRAANGGVVMPDHVPA